MGIEMSRPLYEQIIEGKRQLLIQHCVPTKIRLTRDQYHQLCEELDFALHYPRDPRVKGGPIRIDGMIIEIKESP